MYYQGDVLEEYHTGRVYVVGCAVDDGLEMVPGHLHPRFGSFIQDQNPVSVVTSYCPRGFAKIGIAPSFFPGAMRLK